MKLTGLRGLSAWLVYNKIVFSLVFLRRFNVEHNEQLALIESLKSCNSLDEYKEVAKELSAEKYKAVFYSQADAINIFKESDEINKRQMLFECLTFTTLTDEECLRLLALHTDDNGVPYSKANINNIDAGDIVPMLIDSLIACANEYCDLSLLSEEDLAIFNKGRVDIKDDANDIVSSNSDTDTGSIISIALKKIVTRFKQ